MIFKIFKDNDADCLESKVQEFLSDKDVSLDFVNISLHFFGEEIVASVLFDDRCLCDDEGIQSVYTGKVPDCPECGIKMVERRRNSDNRPFWGCPGFPKCRGIRAFDDVDDSGGNEGNTSSSFDDGDDIPF